MARGDSLAGGRARNARRPPCLWLCGRRYSIRFSSNTTGLAREQCLGFVLHQHPDAVDAQQGSDGDVDQVHC